MCEPIGFKRHKEYPPFLDLTNVNGSLLSVELEDGEEIQWHYTYYPNGSCTVSGYTIVKKADSAIRRNNSKRRFSKKKFILSNLLRR
jgi:hypothetical protein